MEKIERRDLIKRMILAAVIFVIAPFLSATSLQDVQPVSWKQSISSILPAAENSKFNTV